MVRLGLAFCSGTQWGRPVRILTPRSPSTHPKVFELVFVQLEIFGKTSGAAGAEECFPGTLYGVKLFHPPFKCA